MVGKDGVKVPVSLVWRKDIHTPKALLLYGYGAYGTPMRPYYQPQVLSLLDRGFVYAIAHVRGGGMLGMRGIWPDAVATSSTAWTTS